MSPAKLVKVSLGWLPSSLVTLLLLQSGCESAELPTLITWVVTEITYESADCGGRISSDGGGDISSRGLVWDTIMNPTIEKNAGINDQGSGVRLFFITMTGLAPGKDYYVRAYATNEAGTAYGEQILFTTSTPVSMLEQNTLVLSAETGATVNLELAAQLVGGTIYKNTVTWDSYLADYNIGSYIEVPPYNGVNFPSGIHLFFSLSASGSYNMKVRSPYNPNYALAVLGFRKYLQPQLTRAIYYWSTLTESLPADYYKDPFDPLLMTSPMQAIMSYEFGYLRERNAITSGPDNYYDFGKKLLDSYILRSGFPKPVFYVFSMIHHIQSDYAGYNNLLHEIDRYYNSKFSMAPPESWDISFTGKRNFSITPEGVVYSCIFGKIVCENNNSGYSKINGTNLIDLTSRYSKEILNYNSTAPVSIELGLTSTYALAWTAISYIVCADAVVVSDWNEERDGAPNPADSWDQNPEPVIIKINSTGTTIVK